MFLLLAAAMPGLGKVITLSAPFDLFTTERTLESRTISGNGTEKIVERTVVGQWTYFYRVTATYKNGRTVTMRQQIDPVTRQDVKPTGVTLVVTIIVLFVYWITMEASPYQASLGKLTLGMKVVDGHGERVTIPRATVRNMLKPLSAVGMFLLSPYPGSSWSRRKQGGQVPIHDIVTGCHVVSRFG